MHWPKIKFYIKVSFICVKLYNLIEDNEIKIPLRVLQNADTHAENQAQEIRAEMWSQNCTSISDH